ncbi:MAG: AAA family ATPase [Marinilabiliaceae bacterium]|nr:AAA family ATPase [Marinilabiliaceae bacterium]
MYLKQFSIKNFRSIENLTLNLNKGVNIIIGENNAGKTAIIDALRICLNYGNLSRDIYIKKDEDFFIDSNEPGHESDEIRFDLIFQPESIAERSVFIDFIRQDPEDITFQTIELHFRYYFEHKNNKRILRWQVWGGEHEGQSVPVEALQLINHTYLGALRDATEKLKPHGYGNKIASLYRNLRQFNEKDGKNVKLTYDVKEELANELKEQVESGNWSQVVKTGNEKVLTHIQHSSINGKEPTVEFSFLPYTYEGIVDSIEARKPVYEVNGHPITKQRYFRVSQNGLGENNIIYAGTVLGDLIGQKEYGEEENFYNALLIEEPEAHLHPQKQNTFFQYISSLDQSGIQIFLTSHSPTITAKTDLDYIITLQRQGNKIQSFSVHNSELTVANKKYLSKFLDVTKSQLFFANGVILVEGISEALLMPVFSKIIKEDLDKNGVEIVNLNGVAFEHFARLFNSKDPAKRLMTKCALLTDDDKGQIGKNAFIVKDVVDKKKSESIFNQLKVVGIIDQLNRIRTIDVDHIDFEKGISKDAVKIKLEELIEEKSARALVAEEFEGGNLDVQMAEITMEYELMIASSFNLRLVKYIYSKKMHHRTEFASNEETLEYQAYDILTKLYSKRDKSELAHNLAVFLEDRPHLWANFVVPEYIAKGIKWATKRDASWD